MRKFLIVTIVILSLILTGLLGFMWYDATHFYVDGQAYSYYAKTLDLREKEITLEHYQAVQSQLPACEILWNVPLEGGSFSSDSTQLTLTALGEQDLNLLADYFPNLQRIDASACKNYALLAELADRVSGCEVVYQVALGGANADPNATTLTLESGNFVFDVLLENLTYLPELETVHFPKSQLTQEQLEALAEAYPEITVTGTVELLDKEYDTRTTSLDLSAMTSADVADVAGKLSMLTALQDVELMNANGVSKLTMEDVRTLQEAVPGAAFHYVFDFYGITVSTLDEEVIIKGIKVEDGRLEENLRLALGLMENCRRFVLEARGAYDKLWDHINHATLAQIREEFRDQTKLVWRVYFGDNGSSLTDAQVLRAVYGLTDDNSKNLVYCENVRYLDLGHNEYLDYMDFLSGMKELEVAILSGAPLKDLSPIAACKNLKFLEIANCIYLPGIEALAECTQLEMLNISFTRFTDVSVLEKLNLTHLTAVQTQIPDEFMEQYIADHPDCWTVYEGDQPYGVGWRYAENGQDFLEWYAKMVDAFKYPNPYNNVGWYLDNE